MLKNMGFLKQGCKLKSQFEKKMTAKENIIRMCKEEIKRETG